jgi:two-component system phosphate regulon response regulator PhoB
VDTHVRRLRKKLGKAALAVETVRGFGYRIRES